MPTNRIEKDVAAFPDELPRRLIKLFSYVGETVLDPFLGSGTTSRVARELGRNSIGYEINLECLDVIKAKLSCREQSLFSDDKVEFLIREDATRWVNKSIKGTVHG